ncbi:DEAD-box ATP-dependent RNA helicase 36 [Iris pallida]|uniref:DEAD-box ATP-dependent RNA helicase 36 n=1 Tax=Iris pallida TaxID=29817 RepID=A0AAX6IGL3_IRIPA|nr:DEAD-box ATP-dependent RNA helicase 36 [Iris pallida]
MEEAREEEHPFRLFSNKPIARKPPPTKPSPIPKEEAHADADDDDHAGTSEASSLSSLGLADWAVSVCAELGIRTPTPVQSHCIPRILAGDDVLGLAQTGSGKTAAFALPILHRLSEDPFGVFALVITPTRELAVQIIEQFRALGAPLSVRVALVVGGMAMGAQAKALLQRPHVVVATPGRIRALMEGDRDVAAAFSKTKFLVLDEADRVLDVGFEDELGVIFKCLPRSRQTLLFSATMTSDLQALLEISANKSYFYEAYEGFKTVDSLKQHYIFIPKNVKDVYLHHVLTKMEDDGIRSAIVFVSTCRSCHLLSLLLEELDINAVALHSHNSQSLRLSALHRFKSGQVPILLATDVASRGLDIPTVDLVINYDIPRFPRDYVHRVGRTARAGRGGLSLSFVTQNDVDLILEIEADIKQKLDAYECKENEVLEDITKVYKARRVARMKMIDDGFDEKAEIRKAQKLKTMAEKGLQKKRKTKD